MNDKVENFSTMLAGALGAKISVGATSFIEMLAEDAIMEFPYAPSGLPRFLVGRDIIAKHLEHLAQFIAFDRIGKPVIYSVENSDTTILEFDGTGIGIKTRASYEQKYVSVIRTENGRIVHYRDYWNPLAVLLAIKGPEVQKAISIESFSND